MGDIEQVLPATAPWDAVVTSPIGFVGIGMQGDAVCRLAVLPADTPPRPAANEAARELLDQLFQYFVDPSWPIEARLALDGTAFQRRVWAELGRIPLGQVAEYGTLASALGSSARAVGAACRSNPIPVIVPCHRVVSRRGLGGYMGAVDGPALAVKKWLLRHERATGFCSAAE
jgi:methylated-DNA-[protein]-cysteine S-methyltransferase